MDVLMLTAFLLPFLGKFRKIATTFAFFLALFLAINNNYFIAVFFFTLSLAILWLSDWTDAKYPLFFLAMFDLIGLLNSSNLFELFIYFELAIYASYFLIADPNNFKTLFRYFVVNSIGSAFMLFSIALSFFNTGSLTSISNGPLIFFVIGLLIKLGIAPFQDWLVEIYKTVSLSSSLFFASVLTSVSPLALLLVIKQPSLPLQLFALLSMFIANLMALREDSLKRILALFGASNLAYGLLAISTASEASRFAALFIMLSHVIAISFALTALAISQSTKLNNLKAPAGLELPFYAAFFALSGLPPFHLFPAKLLLFSAVFTESHPFSYLLLINLALGAFTSIRILSGIQGSIKLKIPKKFRILLFGFLILSLLLGLFPLLFTKALQSQMQLFSN